MNLRFRDTGVLRTRLDDGSVVKKMPHIREGRNSSHFSSRSFLASPKRLEPQRESTLPVFRGHRT